MDETKIIDALQVLGAVNQLVTSHEQSIIKIFERLGAQEAAAGITSVSVSQIKESLTDFKNDQQRANENFKNDQQKANEKLLAEVQCLKDKPGKRWDLIVTVIITSVCSGSVGAIIAVIIS